MQIGQCLTVEQLWLRLRNYVRSHPDAPVEFQMEGEKPARIIHTSLTFSLDDGQKLIVAGRREEPSECP